MISLCKQVFKGWSKCIQAEKLTDKFHMEMWSYFVPWRCKTLCKYGGRCESINCVFKHIILEYSSNDDEESDDDENDIENVDDINSEGNDDIVSKEKKN